MAVISYISLRFNVVIIIKTMSQRRCWRCPTPTLKNFSKASNFQWHMKAFKWHVACGPRNKHYDDISHRRVEDRRGNRSHQLNMVCKSSADGFIFGVPLKTVCSLAGTCKKINKATLISKHVGSIYFRSSHRSSSCEMGVYRVILSSVILWAVPLCLWKQKSVFKVRLQNVTLGLCNYKHY